MKILLLADEESKYLWDYFEKSKLDGIDLIISCGDLKPAYLSFLATFAKVPVLYVHGNHDGVYDRTPPEGCICIEDSIYVYKGVRILGLGGSMNYKDGPHQYTEGQMESRIRKLRLKLWRHKGFDILITHSPAKDVNDGDDRPHMGFQAFRNLLDKYMPKYFIHGHVHLNYKWNQQREYKYNEHTTIVNAFERYILDYKE